jgi:uracil-DNA glycosylase family 4
VPGFGDPAARVLVLGLAPAAHGANRTGRVFTGDRSGDWLFRSMHTTGFANQPTSASVDDGLELRGAWVTAAVKCAPPDNTPLPAERDTCRPFLQREMALLASVSVIVCLGGFAFQAACQSSACALARFSRGWRRSHTTAHAAVLVPPSQQNTFTKRLTEPMLGAVFVRRRTGGSQRPATPAPARPATRAPRAQRPRRCRPRTVRRTPPPCAPPQNTSFNEPSASN